MAQINVGRWFNQWIDYLYLTVLEKIIHQLQVCRMVLSTLEPGNLSNHLHQTGICFKNINTQMMLITTPNVESLGFSGILLFTSDT